MKRIELENIKLYFSDYFGVDESELDAYGAFNISLVSDLPLFIDPFLLFNSAKPEYQVLHEDIIKYLAFLRDSSVKGKVNAGILRSWYLFGEVKQNWLGFTILGNGGSGLGPKFARALHDNLNTIFSNFGKEKITSSSHLEKLCLIADGVGKDSISDFTTNLIKGYLLEYTQEFANRFIDPKLRAKISVPKVKFNYRTEVWESAVFDLPVFGDDYVLLTPSDILTKDSTWINREDLFKDFEEIPDAIPDESLRAQISNYFNKRLEEYERDREPTSEERNEAIQATLREYPRLIDYFIKHKEDNGDEAVELSRDKVTESHAFYVEQARQVIEELTKNPDFYAKPLSSYDEALDKVLAFKSYVENNDGYRLINKKHDGKPINNEKEVQLFFGLIWHGSKFDYNREPNNGRGPVDGKVSMGAWEKTLIEFKLASNTRLRQNLEKQVTIYEKANGTRQSVKVIVFYTEEQQRSVESILRDLKLENEESIVMIDARDDNKPSASKA